jgi:hypothetical protein
MAKSTSGKAAPAAAKIKTAVSLSPRAYKRLGAACVFLDQNQSELLESLIATHLAGYRVVNDGAKSAVPAMPISSATESHGLDSSVAMSA